MGLPICFILGLLLTLAHSGKMQELETRDLVLNHTVMGILGEEVYLCCLYTGESKIQFSSWNRLDSAMKAKKMAGFNLVSGFFKRENFDVPASDTNLTVKVNVTSFDQEGEYICVFNSEEDEIKGTMFLSVIARPDITIFVKEEVVNRSLHHAVTCSASAAKPEAVITWQIAGHPPNHEIFSVTTTSTVHPNGTNSSVSVLRFPLVMNNESSITCVVEHPAFAEPKRTDIEVDTFDSPVVSMEIFLVQEGGEDFQEVTCKATGGSPHPNITWRMPELKHTQLLQKNIQNPTAVISSYRFPSELYEGQNVTCSFDYMFFPFMTTRTVTLPVYDLSSIQLKDVDNASRDNQTSFVFEEGDTDITIRLEVWGHVPSYEINCSWKGQPLPEDVVWVGDDLFIKGPIDLDHGGLYQCQASYRNHTVSLEFTIQILPKAMLPVTISPNITVDVVQSSNFIQVECLASNSVPAANITWYLPPEINTTVQSVITSSNESHSVRSVLKVAGCMSSKYLIACEVSHPNFVEKQCHPIMLPVCAAPRVSLQWSSEWHSGIALARLECKVETQSPTALVGIRWAAQCHAFDSGSSEFIMSQAKVQTSHTGVVQSMALIPIYSLTGCSVTCAAEQQGFDKPVNKSMVLPVLGSSSSHILVAEESGGQFWHAVCEYSGEGVKPNISWILPEKDVEEAMVEYKYNGTRVEISSTFEFELSQYEGKDLICLIQNEFSQDERRKIHVPKYSISLVEVVNKTTILHRSHGQLEHRLELQENISNQKIIFKVRGNAPLYKTTCYRSDGSAAQTAGMALVFTAPVTEWDAGLYICHLSYHHHMAKVFLQVEVTSEETQHLIFITICFSSAAAITLILIIVLCVLCKCGTSHSAQKKTRMERESLSALMQDPRCSERTLSVQPGNYAELAHFSIVFDAKSTV